MSIFALLASTRGLDGKNRLARADQAAVQLALHSSRQFARDPWIVCPSNDILAAEYAMASGINALTTLEEMSVADFEVGWVGTGGAEFVGDRLLATWAEKRSALLLFDVLHLAESGGIKTVLRDAGRGARDCIEARGPLLLVVSPNVERPTYISRYRRRAGRRNNPNLPEQQRSPDSTDPAERDGRLDWVPVQPRTRVRGRKPIYERADNRLDQAFSIESTRAETEQLIVADPVHCAQQMLRYLAMHGFVSPRVETSLQESVSVSASQPRSPSRHRESDEQITKTPQPSFVPTSVSLESAQARSTTVPASDEYSFIKRRPRQPDDSPRRLSRQPRPRSAAKSIQTNIRGGKAVLRRPRLMSSAERPSADRPQRGPYWCAARPESLQEE